MKKGEFVQVSFPVAAQIKKTNKNGQHTLTILPSPECEACFFDDSDLVRINKKTLNRYTTKEWLDSLKRSKK